MTILAQIPKSQMQSPIHQLASHQVKPVWIRSFWQKATAAEVIKSPCVLKPLLKLPNYLSSGKPWPTNFPQRWNQTHGPTF